MALLTFYGLISVLILLLAFKLDKADHARIAATQPAIMQDSEQSLEDRAKWCRVCGHEISAKDDRCPRCGAQAHINWPMEIALQILGVVLTLAVFAIFGIR